MQKWIENEPELTRR